MNMWLVFEIGINLFQAFMMIYFINRVTHAYHHSFWVDLCSIIIITCAISAYLFFEITISDTILFILPFLHSCFVSRQKWYIRFFWTCVLAIIFIGCINVVCSFCLQLMKITWEVIMGENAFRFAYLILGNLSIFIVLLIVAKVGDQRSLISWGAFGLFILLIFLLLFITEIAFLENINNEVPDQGYTIINLSLLGASLIALCLYELLTASVEKRVQIETELKTVRSIQEHQKELKNLYTSMLRYQHDYRQRLQMIEELVKHGSGKSGDINFADEFAKCCDTKLGFMTGNIAIDALLTAKKATMDTEKITFEYSTYNLNCLPIDEIKFCILLGNLLDNAIEAIQRLPDSVAERKVWLSFSIAQDMLFVVCKNNYAKQSLQIDGNRFCSSKHPKTWHGFGIESVKTICNEANGYCSFKYDDLFFVAKAVLPFCGKN